MSKVSSPKVNSASVAEDFLYVFNNVMRNSSAPMVAFAEQYDLNFTQLKLMFALANADEPLPIGRLAEAIGSSLPATGRGVDALVRHGLATRTEDPTDRRVKRIEPTKLGAESMDAIWATRVATLNKILKQLPPEQIDALASALAPLRQETEGSQ